MTGARIERHARVSAALSSLSDRRLGALLDDARPLGTGIGGSAVTLTVDGVPVFAKRIALADLERRAEHERSTANLFGMPAFCQYGITAHGSPGFGAWREVVAHELTTRWVLDGRTEAFPLLYHWRVLPGAPPPPDELADVARVVDYWGGSSAVRRRIEALAEASAGLVLFLEHVPWSLQEWLPTNATGPAIERVERQLLAAVVVMNSGGLFHFDAHFRNVLTDGRRLYLGDLGLATSPAFELSADEADFLRRHDTHDAGYVATQLVNWLVTHVCGVGVPAEGGPVERNAYIRRCAEGVPPENVPASVAALIMRHAPVAVVMNEFYWDVFGVSPATAYPAEAVRRALARGGADGASALRLRR